VFHFFGFLIHHLSSTGGRGPISRFLNFVSPNENTRLIPIVLGVFHGSLFTAHSSRFAVRFFLHVSCFHQLILQNPVIRTLPLKNLLTSYRHL
jgi:hypothetical protein